MEKMHLTHTHTQTERERERETHTHTLPLSHPIHIVCLQNILFTIIKFTQFP